MRPCASSCVPATPKRNSVAFSAPDAYLTEMRKAGEGIVPSPAFFLVKTYSRRPTVLLRKRTVPNSPAQFPKIRCQGGLAIYDHPGILLQYNALLKDRFFQRQPTELWAELTEEQSAALTAAVLMQATGEQGQELKGQACQGPPAQALAAGCSPCL